MTERQSVDMEKAAYNDDSDVELLAGEDKSLLDEDPAAKVDYEYLVSTSVKLACLCGYLLLNLSLTLYSKFVLQEFRFPWLLTALHTSFASAGCYILMLRGYFTLTRLTRQENLVLVAFSTLFTVNIAVSNLSLSMVSVPFHQTLRSTCPLFTVIIYRFYYSRTYSTATYLSLIPVIIGVIMVTYGDFYCTTWGFILTIAGVLLAAAKTIATNRVLTGNLKLPALEVLLRMSPLAALQSLIFAALTGEASTFTHFVKDGKMTNTLILGLLGNGFLALVLNISSFQTNKLAGALTLTVAANIKQCLTILLGIFLFKVQLGWLSSAGMMLTAVGAAWFSRAELDSKKAKQQQVQPPDGK